MSIVCIQVLIDMKHVFMGQYCGVLAAMHRQIGVNLVVCEKRNYQGSEIEEFVIDNHLQLLCVENRDELTELFSSKNLKPSIVIVASFGLLLEQSVIDSCREIINFHPGDIYTCRGRHPLPFAILRGDEYCSITVHKIDSEMIDAGPVVAQIRIPIDYARDYEFQSNRLLGYLSALTEDVCSQYKETGHVFALKWDVKSSQYCDSLDRDVLGRIMSVPSLNRLHEK